MPKLLLLGTSGYHPSELRHTSCFMLPDDGLILDAGTAMFRVPRWLRTDHLDIFLSHTHLDHVIGLTFLFDVLLDQPVERVRVHGPADQLSRLDEHLFASSLFPARPPIDWQPLTNPVKLPGDPAVTWFPLEHPGGSVGYRLDWPHTSLAYVTDTTARRGADYVDRIRGVKLLLHECHFADGDEQLALLTGHSCTTAVAEIAREAEVDRLVLVHINPMSRAEDPVGLRRARAIFPRTEVGTDQMEIDF
jgi:ribonuclease Z